MYSFNKRLLILFTILFLITTVFTCIDEHELICLRIIDGDTIELNNGIVVRYIGIDTPERDEPMYQESVEANRNLVEGKQVRLEYDKQRQDRHSRTLAYVYTNGAFVNCELLRLGVAEIATYQQTLKYLDSLIECQQEALNNRRGIWEGVLDEDIVHITATGDKQSGQAKV